LVAGSAYARPRGGLLGWAQRNFTVRAEVRQVRKDARDMVKSGDLHAASQRLSDLRSNPQGLREHLVLASAKHEVTNATLGELQARSAKGDAVGSEDARQSLTTLRTNKLMWLANWRAARAENRAFKNILGAAKHAGRLGNLAQARDNLSYAAQLRGQSNVRVAKGIRTLYKQSMKTAAKKAWQGDFQSTHLALQTAASAAEAGGGRFDVGHAQKLMKRAFRYAVPNLITMADLSWRRGDSDGAALALQQSMEIQRSEGIRPNFVLAHRQRKLLAHLGPRIAAQQVASAETEAQTPSE
jgi:hypothetical protein